MCFIKTVVRPESTNHVVPELTYSSKAVAFNDFTKRKNFHDTKQSQPLKRSFVQSNSQAFLLALLSARLTKNTFEINNIAKEISSCEQSLNHLLDEMQDHQNEQENEQESHQTQQIHSTLNLPDLQSPSTKEHFSQNVLTNLLFGQRKYRYRLQLLNDDFDPVLYKERNLKLNVVLKNMNGNVIKNSNIVNLCFALADDNGSWISSNRVGDSMLKGKTEVQLYHGEAEFAKIYAKDISRTFPNGTVNIVIYTKPSMLIYDGLTSDYEEHVDEMSIEPLILDGVVIKAKKK